MTSRHWIDVLFSTTQICIIYAVSLIIIDFLLLLCNFGQIFFWFIILDNKLLNFRVPWMDPRMIFLIPRPPWVMTWARPWKFQILQTWQLCVIRRSFTATSSFWPPGMPPRREGGDIGSQKFYYLYERFHIFWLNNFLDFIWICLLIRLIVKNLWKGEFCVSILGMFINFRPLVYLFRTLSWSLIYFFSQSSCQNKVKL